MSLYTDLVAAGVPLDNHYSDLYVKVTPEASALIKAHHASATPFRSQIDGDWWYDVPFAFEPYWESRRSPDAASA